MTTIAIKESAFGTRDIHVNGRFVDCAGRIESVEKTGPGRFEGMAGGELFSIIGGKESGGGVNEWFLKWAVGYGEMLVPAKSAKHCINLIESC